MKLLFASAFFALTTPLLTLAQTATGGQQTLQTFIKNTVLFLSSTIVPFLLAIAFLIFVINVVRFFVLQSGNEDGQKNAKSLALYSVLAFLFILIFWGLVNTLVSSFGLSTGGPPRSDYEFPDQQPGIVPPSDDPGRANPQATTPNNPSAANPQQQGSFTPPSDNRPTNPPPISDELEGLPEDDGIFGGPGRGNL
jgi:hypothetical protein